MKILNFEFQARAVCCLISNYHCRFSGNLFWFLLLKRQSCNKKNVKWLELLTLLPIMHHFAFKMYTNVISAHQILKKVNSKLIENYIHWNCFEYSMKTWLYTRLLCLVWHHPVADVERFRQKWDSKQRNRLSCSKKAVVHTHSLMKFQSCFQ